MKWLRGPDEMVSRAGFGPRAVVWRLLDKWTKGLQNVVRWFLDADDNPDSHQKLIITFLAHLQCSLKFACKFIPW